MQHRRWHNFFKHLSSYVIVIGMLAVINFITDSSYWWFLWPALGWGVGLAFDLQRILFAAADENSKEVEAIRETPPAKVSRESRPAATTTLTSQPLQAHVVKARAYQAQIDQLLKSTTGADARARLETLANHVTEWTQAIDALARRVDNFQHDKLIRQDMETVPKSIAALKRRLSAEADPATQSELQRTLSSRQQQLGSLEQLQNSMARAELKIESTMSTLGTLYSQILTGQSTSHVADYSRLAAEADEEARALQDYLEALEEVKMGRT